MTPLILTVDLETDGLLENVSQIWCVGVLNNSTDEFYAFTGDAIPDALLLLQEADVLIMHNGKEYDSKVIEKLTDGLITLDPLKIVDTLQLSREVVPEMKSHSLKSWGEVLEFPKGDHHDWSQLSEEMIAYCERDVRLTKAVFDTLYEIMHS